MVDQSHKQRKGGVKTVQAVEKALRILEVMGDVSRPLNLADLAERVQMHPSTLYRLLITLCRSGFVVHDAKAGQYRLSIKAYQIGQAAIESVDFRRDARPVMESLVDHCDETANLVILHERDAVFVEQVESTKVLRSLVTLGSSIPAHASGGGKALLAEAHPGRITELYRTYSFFPFTAHTLTHLEQLQRSLAKIRDVGYAVDDEEWEEGVRCVGAAVRDHTGHAVAALTVTGPAGRLTRNYIETRLAATVVEHAGMISAHLGLKNAVSI